MSVTARPTSGAKVNFRVMEKAGRAQQKSIRSALHQVGNDSQRHMKRELGSGTRSGAFYRHNGILVQSSAPGELPARRSGGLIRSIDYSVRAARELEVGSKASYGRFLEEGTRTIRPRPFIENTSSRHQTLMAKLLQEAAIQPFRKGIRVSGT